MEEGGSSLVNGTGGSLQPIGADEEGIIQEEGQADIEMRDNEIGSVELANTALKVESNLGTVLSTIKVVLSRFQQDPIQHIDKDNA
jgi:hypothetical protein